MRNFSLKLALVKLLRRLFNEHLFLTNTVGCSLLMSLGDCAQQKIERTFDKKRTHDWSRTARMFAMGFVLGPMAHGWYSWLDRRIPIKTGKAVLKKILYDQSIASPLFSFTFITGKIFFQIRLV